ncbi:MAG: helix-turn-helix transcriptional regulator [Phascolarctobacterium sp.]|nr:helix-turn-helix transcriptional regulator [Phascolarctobacterium sp.]
MIEEYNKLIGTRVKMIRITKGVSQTELAKEIGVTQTHLSNIENGRAGLTIPNLIKLHEALHTPISSFFEDIEGKPDEDKKSDVTLEDLTDLLRLLKGSRN